MSVLSAVSCWDVGDFWSEQLRLRKVNDCQRIILHAAMPEVTEVHAGIFFSSVKDEAGQTVRSEQLDFQWTQCSVHRVLKWNQDRKCSGCRSDPMIPPGRVYQRDKICCQLIAVCVKNKWWYWERNEGDEKTFFSQKQQKGREIKLKLLRADVRYSQRFFRRDWNDADDVVCDGLRVFHSLRSNQQSCVLKQNARPCRNQ